MVPVIETADGGDKKASAQPATGVVVLGSGRSGTSAVTRAFIASGFFAGGDNELYGAGAGNPLGHYEALSVLELNEEILAAFNCHWWGDAPPAEEQLPRCVALAPRLKAVLENLIESANGAPAVVKEPRINGLLPLWQPVLEGVLHPVLVVRDPLEIALSHSRRDGTSVAHALASWECQTIRIFHWLHERTVTIAHYANLIDRPALANDLVRDAASHLEQGRAAHVHPTEAASALHPQLRNENATVLAHDDYLTVRQAALWQYLKTLPTGDTLVDVPPELLRANPASQATMRKESERVALLEAHAAMVEEVKKAMKSTRTLERELSAARSVAQMEAVKVEQHARELASVHRSISWRTTAALRRLKAVAGRRP